MMECPCRYCKDRNVNCHAICKKYKQWSKENERLRKIIHKRLNSERLHEEDLINKRLRRKRK